MRLVSVGALLALGVSVVAGAASAQIVSRDMYGNPIPAPMGGGINPYGQYAQPRPYTAPAPAYAAPPVYYAPSPAPVPMYAPPANGYGEISKETGLPRTNYVNGYYRADGTYVQPYYRSQR